VADGDRCGRRHIIERLPRLGVRQRGTMSLRELRVDMHALLDARQRAAEDSSKPYLDLRTGEVLWSIDEMVSGEPNEVEALLQQDPDRFAFIEREEGSEAWQGMRDFAGAVEEDDIRVALVDALEGRGAFGRFRAIIARYPDLRDQWEAAEWERRAREVETWLEGLDVRAIYAPPPSAAQPVPPPPRSPRVAVPGFLDLLLLGAPEGKTELLDGKVRRESPARDPSLARAMFTHLARELAEVHGIGWRKRFVASKSTYEVGCYRLIESQDRVELEVAVSPELWRAFTWPAYRPPK
jgi:hypothetical protein